MSSEPDNNTVKKDNVLAVWCSNRYDEGKLLSKTMIALLFIVNSIALGLYGFGLVHPDKKLAALFGAISFAFAAVVLGTFVHQGVKYQSVSNKRKR